MGNLIWRLMLLCLITLVIRSSYSVAWDIHDTLTSSHWPSVPGIVDRFTDADAGNAPRSWRANHIVEYKYAVNDREYIGSCIAFNRRAKWYYSDVKALTQSWRDNPQLRVFYNPSMPQKSTLQPGGSIFANVIFLCLQLTVIAALAWLFKWSFRQKQISIAPEALSNNA